MSRVIVCKLGRLGELRKLLDCNTNNPISVPKILNLEQDKDKDKSKRRKIGGRNNQDIDIDIDIDIDTVGHMENERQMTTAPIIFISSFFYHLRL